MGIPENKKGGRNGDNDCCDLNGYECIGNRNYPYQRRKCHGCHIPDLPFERRKEAD